MRSASGAPVRRIRGGRARRLRAALGMRTRARRGASVPKCDYCGSTILFGGKRDGEFRFCNDRCHQSGVLLAVSRQVPDNLVQQQVWSVHQGRCPRCGGTGPTDVHVSHRVWSALVLTSWASRPQVSCRRCGMKSQAGDALFSLVLGWWGFPWGLVMTPVQIGRNLVGLAKGPDPTKPSPQLEKIVRMSMANRALVTGSGKPDASSS